VGQTKLLARTFFVRLFESDLMPAGLPQVQLLIWSVVLIAGPALTLPGIFTQKYSRLWFYGGLSAAITTDRLVLIAYAMVAVGFVALVIWEGALPDRRDARVLGVLPVATRTFISARLLAIGMVFAIFFAAIGGIPAVLFSSLAASYLEAPGFIRGIGAHFIAVLAATASMFCGVIALQCLIVNVLGRVVAQRVAVLFQIGFAIALGEMLLFLPVLARPLSDGAIVPNWLSSPTARLVPPVWYLSVYDVLSGYGGRNAFPLARIGALVTIASLASAFILYALSYSRMMAMALETPPHDSGWARSLRWIRHALSPRRLFPSGRPVAAATRAFTLRTLFRTRQHRMLFALYIGFGLAIAISAIGSLALQRGAAGFSQPRVPVLAAPLVLTFCVLVGMRVLFAIPVEPKANWMFRLRQPADAVAAIDGVRAAMMMVGVLPSVVIAIVGAGWLWGPQVARVAAIADGLLGWLLVELLLIQFYKLPFTCTYLPGRSRIKTLWPFYLSGFTTFSFSMAELQRQMVQRPGLFATFCVILGLAIVALTMVRAWNLAGLTAFRFEEEDPDALFAGFKLSEGIAADARLRSLKLIRAPAGEPPDARS
jgi:hypothetical protein